MMLDYFYGQSGELFAYFRIPKALFQDSRFRQLSTDARTLYGILLDRMSLSVKNNWLDEQGRVYIIYTVREVQESLCCAEHKAVKLFRELEQADLIERKRRGLGRPSLIYVKNFSSGLPKAQIQNCANSSSCAAESAVQVRPKSQSNKTDKNKTERNHPFLPDETDSLVGNAHGQCTGGGRHDTDSDASAIPFCQRSGAALADDWKSSAADKPKIKNRGYFAHHDGQPHHLWKADRQSNPARLWPEDQCIRADDSPVCPCR